MKRFSTFLLTLMLVVFATNAFAQGGPKRTEAFNPDFTSTGNYKAGGTLTTLGGVKCDVLSDNLVKNWSFEDGLNGSDNDAGWTTAGTDFPAISEAYGFEQREGGVSGDFYLIGTQNANASSTGSICTVWGLEAGKTYYFSYWVKALVTVADPADGVNGGYLKVYLTNTQGDEPTAGMLSDGIHVDEEWQKVEVLFTNDNYSYLQVKFRWLGGEVGGQWGFDDFEIYEVDPYEEVESTYQAGDAPEIDGVTYSILSDNLISNHSFELGMGGWYSANYLEEGGDYLGHPAITSDNFTLVRNGDKDANGDEVYGGLEAQSGKRYLVGTGNTGAQGAAALWNAWPVEKGKSYLFRFNIAALKEGTSADYEGPDAQFIVTSLVNTPNTTVTNNSWNETEGRIVDSGEGMSTPVEKWKQIEAPFTNTEGYAYLQIDYRWLSENFAFDSFELYETEAGVVELTAHEEKFNDPDPFTDGYEAFGHWSIAGNTGGELFQLNTWSKATNIDGTSACEYWIGSWNGNLSAATISHETIFGLPAGNYNVSIVASITSESDPSGTIGAGTTFNANGKSVDLVTDGTYTKATVGNNYSGTYTVETTVGDDGTLDISFTIPSGVVYNWMQFQNLKVEYADSSVPTVVALKDAMDATVKATMDAAVAAYTADPTSDNFEAAITALQPAYASAAEYAEVAAVVDALDDAGLAVWEVSTSASAYETGTLTADQVHDGLAAAQIAQITAGSDMTYVLKYTGDWKKDECGVINFGICGSLTSAHEAWSSSTFTGSTESPTRPLYKEIVDLPAGAYEISFYAYAAQGTAGTVLAFANEETANVTVDATSVGPNWSNESELITLTCIVGEDGVLDFGLKCIGAGAWYVAEEYSLTLLSGDTESDYHIGDVITHEGADYVVLSENLIDNHSFELGMAGWYSTEEVNAAGDNFANEITSTNFEWASDDAEDGDFYIIGLKQGGQDSERSLGNAWPLEELSYYYFSFWIKGLTDDTDASFMKASITNTIGTETEVVLNGTTGVGNEWQKVEVIFRNADYHYMQIMFRWLADDNGNPRWAFDNFQLYNLQEPQAVELVAHAEDFSTDAAAAEALTHWTTTGNNGTHEVNTWSTEAERGDASGMVTPFLQNWVYGETLTAATISHKQLVGLPAGDYEVSMDIRLFSEQGLAMAAGTTFNANDASEDLVTGDDATPGVFDDETEFYGNYKLDCTVGEEGTLDISIVIPEEGVTYNWISWKNLKVVMLTSTDEEMPTLAGVEGPMNAEVEAAMDAAIAAYEADPTSDTFNAAIDAIQDAAASAEIYAEIAALVEALDETGAAVWATTESAAALADGSLETLDEIDADMTAAQAAQTTAVTDWTYVVKNTGAWTADQGNGPGTYATTATETYLGTGGYTEGKVLYKTVEGLVQGTYEVSFYAVASCTSSRDTSVTPTEGEGVAQAFANDAAVDIEVIEQISCTPTEEAYLCTLTCEVGEDGVLVFGLQNVAEGGNWYVAQEATLTFVEAYVEPIIDDDYAIDDEVEWEGDTYRILGENLFVNGGFNEKVTDVVPGWTAGNTYTDPLLAENVIIETEGGYNGGGFLTLPESVGAASEHTPTQAIKVTPGSTYLFVGYTSGTEPTDANKRYSALFAMQSATEEAHIVEGETTYGEDIITLEWGDGDEELNGWTKTIGAFVATTDYVGMRMNWSKGSYDGLQLYEVESPQVVPGDYLVMVDGNYLAGGLNWGTKGMEGGKPQFIGFEQTDNGLYTLDSYQSNGGDSHYLGVVVSDEGEEEVYFDTAGATWMVLKNDDGTINIGNVAIDEKTGEPDMTVAIGWLKTRGFQNAVELVEGRENATNWTLVKKSEILASMEEATADAPVDVTALIPAAEPKRNAWGDAWTMTAYDGESEIANGALGQGINVASVAESYHSSNGFLFTQIVPDLPVGTYELTAQAFYRNDIADEAELVVPVMYAGDEVAELSELPTELTEEEIAAGITIPNDMVNAYQAFLLEEYPVSVMFYVGEEGDVEIGFSSELATDNQLWTIFGELGLQYYGEEDLLAEPEPEIQPGDVVHECVAEESHWTTDGTTGIALNTWSVEDDASGMVQPFLQLWVWGLDATQPSLEAATVSHEQLTDLEPGTYEVSLDIRIYSEVGNEIGEGTTFNANGVSADLLLEGNEATNSTNDYPSETLVYGTYVLTCTVGEAGTLDISINIPEGVEYNWIAWKNLTVTYIGEAEPEPEIEPGTVVHECEAEIDHWSIADNTNGVFQYNTWSTEADASGMVVPFIEYWVGSWEANLSAATISHETLEDLPAGAYEVTLDIRIFSEAGNALSAGTTLNANGENVDLWVAGTDATYNGNPEVYGTYTVACEVGEDGTLDICIEIPSGVSYNWIAFKNLTVTYIGEELPADNSYQFVCTDWSSIDLGRVTNDNIEYDEVANTITVNAGTGANNVALANGLTAPYTTEDYTVSNEQNWYVVVASNISTDLTDSQLWWMNGVNDGTFYPDYIVELESGEILVAWDLSATTIDTNLQDDVNYLDGWTGFGLTSTTGTSVISDINFYTWKEAVANYPELSTAIATEIGSVETAGTDSAKEGIYTLSGVRISKITKSGIYIVDGKKVLVK